MSTPQTSVSKRRGLAQQSHRRRAPLLNLEHLEDRLAPSANSNFVSNLYTDVLKRAADAGGLAAWTAALDQGALNRTQVALGFVTSLEYRSLLVTQTYGALLGRAPDPASQQAWDAFLAQGNSQSQLDASIASSPEYFQTQAGQTNDGFVVALYRDALNRAPDPGGQAFWDAQLAGGASRFQVASGFFSSTEFQMDLVQSYYHDFLDRAADPGGLTFWVGQLQSGKSDVQVMAGILGSAEFFAISQTTTPVTTAPVVTAPANQTNNEGAVVNGLTVTATGGNGNPLTFSATSLPPGLTINATTGVISGTLTNQSAGAYTVAVSASDGTDTGTASFTWTVADITTPVVTAPANQTNNAGDTVSGVTVTATDADADTLTFSATNLPSGLTINATTGVISGTLSTTSAGTFTVTVNASDGFNTGTANFTWTVSSATAPVVTPPANQTNNEGDVVSGVTVTATGGNGNPLTFAATNLPPGLTINATTGVISGTLTGQSAGTYVVAVSASDGTNTGNSSFQWTVADVTTPVVTAPANQTNNEGDVVSGVTVTATDADGDGLTFSATNLPAGLTINATTGVISGTLTGQSAGTYTVAVSASDGTNTGSANFTWTVADITTPVVTAPANQTNNEGDAVTGVTVTAADADGDPLTFSATNLPAGLTINATTGVISGTLAAGSAGTYTVDVSASDGFNTGTASFTWTVVNPNTPVVTPPAAQTNNEGDVVSGVTVTATGGNGNPLTFSATNLPPGLSINATTGEITGTLTGQSAGTYTVAVQATDGTDTGNATFQWTVADTTTPAVTPPANQTNNEGDVVTGVTVTATDADGDALTFSATNLPSGLTINATTGVISGTLAAGSAGTYTVTVNASDGFNTGTATFTWTVVNPNAPVVTPPPDQTNNHGDVVSGVFVTATGGNGNPLTFTATNLPPGLSINATTGEITGTLTATSAGVYTVAVQASDGTNTGNASFKWTVT